MRPKSQKEAVQETHDTLDCSAELSQEMARLQSLLTSGRVEEARCQVKELEARWPESDLVRRFSRVLAPPVARVAPGRKGMTREETRKESDWLREHAGEYPGCWVILHEDRLIAVDPKLRNAIEEADRRVGSDVGSIHFVPRRVEE
jgi:hypothetical protein